MRIDYTFPELKHPNFDGEILELARILEGKYHILREFSKKVRPKLEKYAKKVLMRKNAKIELLLQEYLKNEWRNYIITGQAGFSVAAQKRGDPAYVDTSAYYLGCQPVCILTEKEKRLFKQ